MLSRLSILVALGLCLGACAPQGASDAETPQATATPLPVPTEAPASPTSAAPPRGPRGDLSQHAGSMQSNATYCTVDGVELKMNFYSPKDVSGPTPLVVYVHGGGWSKGSKDGGAGMQDTPVLLDAGFSVATLDYRLAPQYKFPAMIDDVKCAIRSLRAHAAEYNIDADRIGVWGGSAGGHLVSLLGVTDEQAGFDVGEYLNQSSRVQAVVDLFGPADLTTGFSKGFTDVRDQVFGTFDLALASPVTYISPDDPPFLILQGDADRLVPVSQSQELYDQLTAAGVDATLVIVHNGPHGLGAPDQSPSREELTRMILQFFEENLK
ncbi:MAG TPA: alpha/beta hydrolase [Anaerolineales bacterium]